jgi:epoxide hydrolase-like predicted phosphatase
MGINPAPTVSAISNSNRYDTLKEYKRIEAAIFDLGGVVFGISLDPVFQSWADSIGCQPQDIEAKFRTDSQWAVYERFEIGQISPRQYRDHVCDLLGACLSPEDFDRGWNSIYLELLPGIESLLKQLQKSLRLVVLTNTNEIHAREWRVRYSDVLKYFEKVFASHEIGARKPNPECFQIVLNYLGIDPGKVIFIDDSMENVCGANAVGIKGIVATTPVEEIAEKLRGSGLII